MRQSFRIINISTYLIAILPVKVTEHILILLFTCSKNYYLNLIVVEKLVHNICDEVKALLIGKS